MSRESRTISVLEGDWDRWADLAYAARMSRSEYIRRAVEAYQHGNGKGEGVASPSGGVLRATGKRDGMGGDEQAPWQDTGIVDSRIVGVGGRVEGDSGRGEGSGGAVKREAEAPQQRPTDAQEAEGAKEHCVRDERLHSATQEAIARIQRVRPVPKELQTRRRKKT